MIVVLFRSKLVPTASTDGYDEMAQEMDDLARTMPGFIDVKSFKAEDGDRITDGVRRADAAQLEPPLAVVNRHEVVEDD